MAETKERTALAWPDDASVRRHSRALERVLALLHAHGFTDDLGARLDLSEILLAYGREEHEAALKASA